MNVLIIGTTLDDINFIKNKMIDIVEEDIGGHFKAYVGKYASKNVVLSYSGYGENLASIATTLLIEKYHPYFIINVGTVSSINSSLVQGDLMIGERIYFSDVSMMELNKSKYGQFPSLPSYFQVDADLKQNIAKAIGQISNPVHRGVILSSNTFYLNRNEINKVVENHFLKIENLYAIDTESGGVALAAYLYSIPFIAIKICNYEVGNDKQLINRIRMGVKMTPVQGKLVALLLKLFEGANVD